MTAQPTVREPRNLANISAYLIIPAVGVPVLWSMFQQQEPTRWIASGMLAIFATLFFLRERLLAWLPGWGIYLYLIVQTLLITAVPSITASACWIASLCIPSRSGVVMVSNKPRSIPSKEILRARSLSNSWKG